MQDPQPVSMHYAVKSKSGYDTMPDSPTYSNRAVACHLNCMNCTLETTMPPPPPFLSATANWACMHWLTFLSWPDFDFFWFKNSKAGYLATTTLQATLSDYISYLLSCISARNAIGSIFLSLSSIKLINHNLSSTQTPKCSLPYFFFFFS
jgi:hypothetical protein